VCLAAIFACSVSFAAASACGEVHAFTGVGTKGSIAVVPGLFSSIEAEYDDFVQKLVAEGYSPVYASDLPGQGYEGSTRYAHQNPDTAFVMCIESFLKTIDAIAGKTTPPVPMVCTSIGCAVLALVDPRMLWDHPIVMVSPYFKMSPTSPIRAPLGLTGDWEDQAVLAACQLGALAPWAALPAGMDSLFSLSAVPLVTHCADWAVLLTSDEEKWRTRCGELPITPLTVSASSARKIVCGVVTTADQLAIHTLAGSDVLMVVPDEDKVASKERAKALCEDLPNCELEELSSGKHALWLETDEVVSDLAATASAFIDAAHCAWWKDKVPDYPC